MLIFHKNQLFVSLIFPVVFYFSYPCSDLDDVLPSVSFGFTLFLFHFLSCKFSLLIGDLSSVFNTSVYNYKLPPCTALAAFNTLRCVVFMLSSGWRYFACCPFSSRLLHILHGPAGVQLATTLPRSASSCTPVSKFGPTGALPTLTGGELGS